MDTQKHILVIISPDSNTDYCYLDMSKEKALALFLSSDDWLSLYQPKGYVPVAIEKEIGNTWMMWRNQGEDMADEMETRGLPRDIADMFRQHKKP